MSRRAIAAIVLWGMAACIAQVMLLRESLKASRGNELSIGLALTIWLLGTATGAAAGAALPARGRRALIGIVPLASAFAPLAGLLLARAAPLLWRMEPGRLLSESRLAEVLVLSLWPVCVPFGALFPLACSLLPLPARAVYAAEAGGWLAGGLLATFALAAVPPFTTAALLALVLAGSAVPVMRRAATPALALAVAVAAGLGLRLEDRLEARTRAALLPAQRVVGSAYTPDGQALLLERGGQVALYEDGRFSQALPEPQSAEELAHLALLQVRQPSRVFLAGALGGLLTETLKHPVGSVTVAVQNPKLARLTLAGADPGTRAAARDPRVRWAYGDLRRLLRRGRWDAALLCSPPPSTLRSNRLYTAEFFREAASTLAPGGVLAFGLPGSENYYSGERLARNGSIYRAATRAFRNVAVTPLAANYFLASNGALTLDSEELGRRLRDRGITAQFVNEFYFTALMPPDRVAELAEAYQQAAVAANSDLNPVACRNDLLLAAMEESDRLGNLLEKGRKVPLPLAVVALSALLALLALAAAWRGGAGRLRRWSRLYTVSALGFAVMTLNVAVILTAQIALGAMHYLLGSLVAAATAGLGIGAILGSKFRAAWAPVLAGGALALLLAAVAGSVASWPFWAGACVLAGFGLLAGLCAGWLFAQIVGMGIGPAAAYGADLLGASVAGLAAGTVLVPAHGLRAALHLTAVILALAFSALVFSRPRQRLSGPGLSS